MAGRNRIDSKHSFIPVDDNLIEFAEKRAKEILGKDMAYSPGQTEQTEKGAEWLINKEQKKED